jgi:hypothetical protein
MTTHFLKYLLLAGVIVITGCNSGEKAAQPEKAAKVEEATPVVAQEKPAISKAITTTAEATVTAINHETREVTLQDASGESFTFIASDEVRNLAQVEVGDKLFVEYIEAVDIQVLEPGEAELGVSGSTAAGRAEPGEKPGGAAISQTVLVVEIEAIDKENETVTLKDKQDNVKMVKVHNPANLDKVAIGDKVKITYTESLAIAVTEK